MTVDKHFVRFHKQIGQTISSKKGNLGDNRSKLQAHLCCAYGLKGTKCITGNEKGELIEWRDDKFF